MQKLDVLQALSYLSTACADEIATLLTTNRAAVSMALLRLVRQGLAARRLRGGGHSLRYALTERGLERLHYLTAKRDQLSSRFAHSEGGLDEMKRPRAHNGAFYCPACTVEYELVNESSLKCPDCEGPLAEGTLEDIWDENED